MDYKNLISNKRSVREFKKEEIVYIDEWGKNSTNYRNIRTKRIIRCI